MTSVTIRERSRLNQILVMRFMPEELDEEHRSRAANGIIAYSGLCTHTACGVSEWGAESRHLLCPCHGSEFAPLSHGKRINGPAPRALPNLPIKLADDRLVIAAPFSSAVGAIT